MHSVPVLVLLTFTAGAMIEVDYFGPSGPDGPWNTLGMLLPDDFFDSYYGVALYPSPSWETNLVTPRAGGSWDPEISPTANETKTPGLIPVSLGTALGPSRDDTARYYSEFSWLLAGGYADPIPSSVNTTVLAADSWELSTKNNTKYTQEVNTLGLGPYPGYDISPPPSYIQQLKDLGQVSSNFFGLHVGSVSLSQPISLIIGGYEQNRALGDAAVFDFDERHQAPRIFLVDMVLGTEKGGSPFDSSEIEANGSVSVWPDLEYHDFTQALGGITESAVVAFNPTIPYMHLPTGTCSAIAEYLPVVWEDSIGYYIWDTEDPSCERIVNSPAYFGFTFSDREAQRVTIKVPMKLLNLTLEPPIVTSPLQYFPCQELQSGRGGDYYAWWELGRAFLQAAFVGFNYEKNLTYLAQAPGPDMDQRVVRTHEVEDETIRTNSIDSFQRSWQTTWTPLEGSTGGGAREEEYFSVGTIAGIAVGCFVALWLVALTGFFFWRRRPRAVVPRRAGDLETKLPEVVESAASQEVEAPERPQELNVQENPRELHVRENPLELHVQERPQELYAQRDIHEMSGSEPPMSGVQGRGDDFAHES